MPISLYSYLASAARACGMFIPLAGAQSTLDETTAARVTYVDPAAPSADGTSAGTSQSSPLRTLSAAVLKAAGAPTKIVLRPGDYREYV